MCDWRWPLAINVGVGDGQFFWSPTLSSHFLISPSDTICTVMSSESSSNIWDMLQPVAGTIEPGQFVAASMTNIPSIIAKDGPPRKLSGIMFDSSEEALRSFGEWIDQSATCIDYMYVIYLLDLDHIYILSYIYNDLHVPWFGLLAIPYDFTTQRGKTSRRFSLKWTRRIGPSIWRNVIGASSSSLFLSLSSFVSRSASLPPKKP